MGHANRPRFHDALSLDAQPRRVRLPLVGLGQPNANPDGFAYAYTTKAYSNSGASPDAAASTLDLSGDTRPMVQPRKRMGAESWLAIEGEQSMNRCVAYGPTLSAALSLVAP